VTEEREEGDEVVYLVCVSEVRCNGGREWRGDGDDVKQSQQEEEASYADREREREAGRTGGVL
jgi:hypothetical protein